MGRYALCDCGSGHTHLILADFLFKMIRVSKHISSLPLEEIKSDKLACIYLIVHGHQDS